MHSPRTPEPRATSPYTALAQPERRKSTRYRIPPQLGLISTQSLPSQRGLETFPVAQPGDRRDHLRYKAAGERQNAPNPLEAFQGLPAGLGSGPSRGEE